MDSRLVGWRWTRGESHRIELRNDIGVDKARIQTIDYSPEATHDLLL